MNNAETFKRCQANYDNMQPPDYYAPEHPDCRICGYESKMDDDDGPICEECYNTPDCPKCGNNRQVWRNQITDKITCHRANCQTEIEED
jgi:hypothetical protein